MSACLEELEDDISTTINITKKASIIESLNKQNLLRYGSIITTENVELATGKKKDNLSYESWQFIMLQFREIVKDQGFYVTSRGKSGDLYILQPHEMPMHNDQKTKTMFKNIKQRQRALHMIDVSILSEDHKKKLEFEILKNARIELEMARATKERCR